MTVQDRALLLLGNRGSRVRVDLLDTDFELIEELVGHVISLSPTISSTSDIRRICSLQMHIENKANLSSMSQRIWYDNLIRVYHGIDDGNTVHWYMLGTFLLNENSYTYDAKTQEVTLGLVDMMSAATEIRGSQIGAGGVKIPAGESVRDAFIATVSAFSPFARFNVVEFPDTVPYDLEFQPTDYPYAILSKLLELWPLYQMYYSVDGIFTVDVIPDGIDDPIEIPSDVMDEIIISEKRSNSAKDVRNTTELFGREINADYTAEACETASGVYNLTISTDFEVLGAGSTYSFTPDSASIVGQQIKVQDLPEYPIYEQANDGTEAPLAAGVMEADVHYVVRYAANKFYLQGESQIRVIVQEVSREQTPEEIAAFKEANACRNVRFIVNPDSPFAADKIGTWRQVLKDGEYAGIYTNSLAYERAVFENYKKTRLQDSAEIQCLLIPFLDVNQKIEYHEFNSSHPNSLTITKSGELATSDIDIASNLRFEIIDGELYRVEISNNANTHVSGLVFSVSDDTLEVDGLSNPNVVLVQEISPDYNNYTMTLRCVKFYPYYPF